ncbi:hypothetical protein SAMN05519103_01204 [Rhizobiales bacterium GAS113]|jgi:hypothetical protein|nr:hypothetical protein SAMN05519103_01204 [Rhizobiales bacterium GAS113]SEC36052.1 hypothetical protein SAMN05519104_1231 [Rhizobiales bacterium GAS188]
MRRRFAIFTLMISALASTPACALNNDDFAAMMGMLWRLRDPICPSMSFDPAVFVKAMKLPGGSPAAVRRDHRAAFERGYAVATDWMSQGTTAEFCKAMETFFDGKHDFFGGLKEVPEPPIPGLIIRD